MKPANELSGLEIVVELLKSIWVPAAEALRVQNALNVHSLNETSAAAERAGYEVAYVDLPPKVCGFVGEIGGKPHIVVNRAKSAERQQYTLSHELAHQVLHVNSSRNLMASAFPAEGMEEFQADIFAFFWIWRVAAGKEREDVLRENPEAAACVSLALVMTGFIVAFALVAWLWSHLLRQKRANALKEKCV